MTLPTASTADLAVSDPAAVGIDAARLRRIDDHLDRYIEDGRLAGTHVVVARRGEVVHSSCCGMRDAEAGLPVEQDTLWRIFSMTKPITSVTAMSLFERGLFELSDPVSRWIPAFADMQVWESGTADVPVTRPARQPITMRHLLTHTSGLTYGFMNAHPVDEIYRRNGSVLLHPAGMDLEQAVDLWAGHPLLFEPGSAWGYSVATDVLGRVLEVITGRSLAELFAEIVLEPLGMADTHWWVHGTDAHRLAALYALDPVTGRRVRHQRMGDAALAPPSLLSGGGGLISTAADYHRFVTMLLRGGELGGERILGPRTLRYMTQNHLDGRSIADTGSGSFSEVAYAGVGFGLGFGVTTDPVRSGVLTSVGEFTWGGLASTAFWVDPVEEVTAVFMTQLMPSSSYPLRSQLRQLVYQALVD
jgi:CubicO group peptidase (beta-lactamase class C family)